MQITKELEHDIIVFGGGLTGLSAALEIRERDEDTDIVVVSKVHPVRSHSGATRFGCPIHSF